MMAIRVESEPVVSARRTPNEPRTREEMDSSSHRLSRPSRKYNQVKTAPNSKVETYAMTYFKNNPDAVMDIRPPEEKLADLDERLKAFDLDTSQKFTILIQQKSMIYILYGENSIQSLRIHAALGTFYNQNHRPQSALRHFLKARQLEETNKVENRESALIAVETAEAHLALRNDNRVETQKHISQASEALQRASSEEFDDPDLIYRRDLAKARVLAAKGRIDSAISEYEVVCGQIDQAKKDDAELTKAKLFVEMAEVSSSLPNDGRVPKFYASAYKIFTKLGMVESAETIRDKVPSSLLESDAEDSEVHIADSEGKEGKM